MTRYNTNLAAEFCVLSALYRFGIDTSLTLTNKKSVSVGFGLFCICTGPGDVQSDRNCFAL